MEIQNKNTPGCVCIEEKENQKRKREEGVSKKANKSIIIVMSLDSYNPPKTITADNTKMINQIEKRTKNLYLP